MGVQVGGLDVVPLLGAIARCHVVRCHGKVPLLGAIGWVRTLADWTWCRCWVPLLGAMWLRCDGKVPLDCHSKVPLLGHTLTDWTWCNCWVGWHVVRCHCWVPLLDAI